MFAKKAASCVFIHRQVQFLEFREGFIEHLRVADGETDVVISNCVIDLSPDNAEAFRDVNRILRPGGPISVSVIVINVELLAMVKKSMGAWGTCVAGTLGVKEYINELQAVGFVDVKVESKGKFDGRNCRTGVKFAQFNTGSVIRRSPIEARK